MAVTLPYVDTNSYAQDCSAGTQLRRQQPMAGPDTFGKGNRTELEQNAELGLAGQERSQGCLTNERGIKEKFGAEKSRGIWEPEQK